MASKLTGADVPRFGIQEDIISPPLDTVTQNFKNKINELIDELSAVSIGTTNAETTDARPYHSNLKDRLDSMWDGQFNYVKSGGAVTINGSNQAVTTAGEAKVNGIDVKWSGSTSSAISLTSSNIRFDVVVVNSDSSFSIIAGVESADAVYPTIANTQKPLGLVSVTTTTVTVEDARDWGAYYNHDGQVKWKWKAQDAIDDLDSTVGGKIVLIGKFYEELDYSGNNNIITSGYRASIYRISDTNTAISSVNTVGNETTGNKWIGFKLYGNSKAGSKALMEVVYSDEFEIRGCYFDGNTSSIYIYKNLYISNSDKLSLISNILEGGTTTIGISNSTEYSALYDGEFEITGTAKIDTIEELTSSNGVDIQNTNIDDGVITYGGNSLAVADPPTINSNPIYPLVVIYRAHTETFDPIVEAGGSAWIITIARPTDGSNRVYATGTTFSIGPPLTYVFGNAILVDMASGTVTLSGGSVITVFNSVGGGDCTISIQRIA